MENQSTELVQVLKTSGLAENKQSEIAESLGSFFAKASEWDATIQSIVITSPDEVGKMKMAREGRLTLKGMRLEAEKVVKARRDEIKYRMANDVLEDKLWLKAGQMMEATFKNLETKLEEKEKFAEIWEAKRQAELKLQRDEKLLPYMEFVPPVNTGTMSDVEFIKLFDYAKAQHEAKIEAERKAEQERIEREKAEVAERERIRQENERLKKEAEEREKQMQKEREAAEAERKRIEMQNRKEREALEAKAKAEREAAEKLLQAERKAAQEKAEKEAEQARKLAAELEEKRKSEQAQKEAAEKLAAAPDKEKLKALSAALSSYNLPELKTEKAAQITANVRTLLNKVVAYIDQQSNLL